MVVIPLNVVIVLGRPQKHAKGYMHMCTCNNATMQAILPYKHTIMLGKSTYVQWHFVSQNQ